MSNSATATGSVDFDNAVSSIYSDPRLQLLYRLFENASSKDHRDRITAAINKITAELSAALAPIVESELCKIEATLK